MRSLRPSLAVLAAFALPFAALRASPVSAEGESAASFDSASGLYAASELGLGGRPLYQRLFPSGWPTTREFRKMALDDGEAAFADSIGAVLGSGMGVPLDVSVYEKWRREQLQASQGGRAPGTMDALLTQRWDGFKVVAGLKDAPENFHPVFLPYRHGDAIPEKPFDELKPATWTWQTKGQDQTITLDGVGLAMYAYALFAEQQLAIEHKVEANGTVTTYAGRTDLDGFMALVAMECAIAQLHEVRANLCMNAKGTGGKPELGGAPKNYQEKIDRGEGREVFYPHGFTAAVNKATVSYAIGGADVDKKMRLFDQAALLLGLCELSKAASGKAGSGRFFATDRKGASFDPNTADDAVELAIFVARSIRYVSWNPAHQGCVSSFSTWDSGPGKSLRTEDAGLLLLALEQFLTLKATRNADKLQAAQKDMSFALDRVTSFLVDMQKTSKPPMTGLCDSYDLDNQCADALNGGEEKRSLFAQGLAVRGLLAAKRGSDLPAYQGKAKHPEAKESAYLVLKWVEEKRWDKDRRAYVDEPGKAGKLRAFDAGALLGALRDMALETNDARYLLRYKAYLGTLRARGLMLAETARSRAALDGVKSPADAGKAPVVAAEVTIP